MRFKEFLIEVAGGGFKERVDLPPRSKDISEDEFYKQLKNYSKSVKGFLDNDIKFYRGVRKSIKGKYGFVNPRQSQRSSSYTSNYYTVIMSESPKWKKYPKRDESIVGSSYFYKASGYGDAKIYLVFTHNNGDIAQTHSEDLWGAFKHVFGDNEYPLGEFNEILDAIFDTVGYKDTSPDNSLQELKTACGKVDEFIEENNLSDKIDSLEAIKLLEVYYLDYNIYKRSIGKMYRGDFYKMLLDIFDPQKANIKVLKPGQKFKSNAELWTNADCLLLDYEFVDDDVKNKMRDALK